SPWAPPSELLPQLTNERPAITTARIRRIPHCEPGCGGASISDLLARERRPGRRLYRQRGLTVPVGQGKTLRVLGWQSREVRTRLDRSRGQSNGEPCSVISQSGHHRRVASAV